MLVWPWLISFTELEILILMEEESWRCWTPVTLCTVSRRVRAVLMTWRHVSSCFSQPRVLVLVDKDF